ncbi:MAG: aspartyl protease family protein [Alphaproteobacteria bacterium]|nr:aspartyl protease family protein [Alphaproteobacteria bacterium]MBV9371194.1 aspartyl protease family protein [Alphaproteobacteria bacterium]MBV9899924.1 aspartyl protease family protein [Alphaproteobacteria bacterium]
MPIRRPSPHARAVPSARASSSARPRPSSSSSSSARARALLALALAASLLAAGGGAGGEPPKIHKPRPAPPSAGAMAPLTPAEIDDTLTIGGDDVAAREVETRLSVDVRVNGRGPYSFVVDSGADTSVVGLHIARDLELPLGTPALLNNMTDRNIVDRVKVDSLSVGPSTIRDLQLPALRELDVGGAGMIGIDALRRQRLMLDFEKHLIKVEDAARPPRREPGEIVVVAQLRRGQLILTHVRIGGLSLDAVVDTGSQITIGNKALRDKLMRRHANLRKITAIGVTGKEMELQVGTIDELRLGPVTLANVPMAFADVPPFEAFGLSDRPALLLGTDLLETFRRVSLDFRARKVRFQLRRCKQLVAINVVSSVSLTRLSSAPEACAH